MKLSDAMTTFKPVLWDYATGDPIRIATQDERTESMIASSKDGGIGAITAEIDGIHTTCYVN